MPPVVHDSAPASGRPRSVGRMRESAVVNGDGDGGGERAEETLMKVREGRSEEGREGGGRGGGKRRAIDRDGVGSVGGEGGGARANMRLMGLRR